MPSALLLGYDLEQPSFRHRMRTLAEPLQRAGWQVRLERFPSGRYGVRTWERRDLLGRADVTVLHQIKLSSLEARLFASLSRRRVFDVDDAIYVRKPRRLGEPADDSVWRRRKFAATCRWVDAVAAGNAVLAGVARAAKPAGAGAGAGAGVARAAGRAGKAAGRGAGPDEVAILPTSIDTAPYRTGGVAPGPAPTVVWIGSPENLVYLDMVRPALVRLTARHPALTLRVVCSQFPQWQDVRVEQVPWSAAIEVGALTSAHVGVMPLTDDAWARGKCAFKLLQYMAAALPCVCSPVGANMEAVLDGVTGFHAADAGGWERALGRLLDSATLRTQLGTAGRAHVERRYAMRVYQDEYVSLLTRLAGD